MGQRGRPTGVGVSAVLGLGLVALTAVFASAPASAVSRPARHSRAHSSARPGGRAASAATGWTVVGGSLPATSDPITGTFTNPRMTVEVALAPRDAAALSAELLAVSQPASPSYQHWLAPGAFDARYAPAPATTGAVAAYLRAAGLVVGRGSSPFLLTATGSSAVVAAAFHTTLRTFRDPRGIRYFANSATVELPSRLSGVLGVIGAVRHCA